MKRELTKWATKRVRKRGAEILSAGSVTTASFGPATNVAVALALAQGIWIAS